MGLPDMSLPVDIVGGKSLDQPSIARIRDHWLGGEHNSEVDRAFADQIMVCAPWLPYLVRRQRTMVRRMVEYLLENGVRQFIDLGSGVPTRDYVHEVASGAEPESRVLYVDIDPGVVHDGGELLADNDNVVFLQADIRQPNQVLESAELQELLDLNDPVAVLLIETLLHIPDADDPATVVATYMNAMCSGSYLGLSHFSQNEQLRTGLNLFSRTFGVPPAVTLRQPEQLTEFFSGLHLVDPGIVPVPLWRPAAGEEADLNPEHAGVYVGLGRKP
jgi:hypothetical protein